MRHYFFLGALSILSAVSFPSSASACPCECPTAEEPVAEQTVTITAIEQPEIPAARQFVVVPLDPASVAGQDAVKVVAGVMTPERVTHRAFDAEMIESTWLVPFTCEELDRVVNAVYARHGFFFPKGETRVSFLHFDLRYQPDMNQKVIQIEAKFTSQDQLTLLRAEMALENHNCVSEERNAD
ncbi:hypothetical protein HZA87_04790 [Candidatus Uhrbacteria bacterium]|nr:hypothetical protein [Candidatus Uhrbacteria bacterium]